MIANVSEEINYHKEEVQMVRQEKVALEDILALKA
jgi:hypothetical protein